MSFEFSRLFDKEISSFESDTGYTIVPYAGSLAYVSPKPPDDYGALFDYVSVEVSSYHLWQIIGVDREKNVYILQDGRVLRQLAGVGNPQLIAGALKCSEIADISVNRDGLVLCVGYNPNEFDLVSRTGAHLSIGQPRKGHKQEPIPFWETGANCIFASTDYFAVGRSEISGVDFYNYSGEFIYGIDRFKLNGKDYFIREEYITKIFIDKIGNTWLTNNIDVFAFNKKGDIIYMSKSEEYTYRGTHVEFSRLFGIDKNNGLWGTWNNMPILFSQRRLRSD